MKSNFEEQLPRGDELSPFGNFIYTCPLAYVGCIRDPQNLFVLRPRFSLNGPVYINKKMKTNIVI